MKNLFYPGSVAVIGLSSKQNNIPRITLENMLRWGYQGRIFGVNPRSDEEHVDGIKMYKKIDELPVVPDLAYVLIPAKYIPDMVEECGKAGVKWMAIPSGGFSEFSEEGQKLADLTLENARKYGIRFVGPNGLTVANAANGLCLPFVPLYRPPIGGMSIISQSGGVGVMMWNVIMDENIGIAKFASIGNKLDLDEVDFLKYYGEDPETKIICMYLESIQRGRALIEAAENIDKPIVIYKSNTTTAGKQAAMSHTAAVSNDEDIIDSAFKRAGIIRIHNYHDFFALAKVFKMPPMKGKRIMVMSPAGGFAVMTADLCENEGFEFADPGQDFYRGLQEFSNAGVINFSNPLDMGDIYDPSMTAHVVYSVMHSDKVDGAIYVSQRPHMPDGENVFYRMFLADLSKETWGAILSSAKPLGICLLGESGYMSQVKKAVNFPIFNSPEELVRVMAMQMKFHTGNMRQKENVTRPAGIDQSRVEKWLEKRTGECGEETLELVQAYGITVPENDVATDSKTSVEICGKIGYPVVMKVVSPDALHKSDAGGVIVGIENDGEAEKAFNTIKKNLAAYNKNARFDGVRVMSMADDGYDMFIGGKYDESFGQVIFYGMGGIFIEVFTDVANSLCPVSGDEVMEKLQSLKSYKLLEGARGGQEGDVNALVDIIVRSSHLLSEHPQIKELDLNPVRALPNGKGAVALDARMRIG